MPVAAAAVGRDPYPAGVLTAVRPVAAPDDHRTGERHRVGGAIVTSDPTLGTMHPPQRRQHRARPQATPGAPTADTVAAVPVRAGEPREQADRWVGADRGYAAFVDAHLAELGRLAYLMTGDAAGADDLVADALLAAWQSWDRVTAADSPLAYVRGMVVKMAATRVRRLVRERAHLILLRADARSAVRSDPDTPAVVDVRTALRRLPAGQRACVVLRHGLGLSEEETARSLGVSVGTVKSQTSKAAARLRGLLAEPFDAEEGRRR